MSISHLRHTAAAAVAAGSLVLLAAPAGAQTCYPPTAGCVTTSSVRPTPTTRKPAAVVTGTTGTRGTTSTRGNLARTGAVVVPTALVGAGMVLGGMALKRSSRRSKANSSG